MSHKKTLVLCIRCQMGVHNILSLHASPILLVNCVLNEMNEYLNKNKTNKFYLILILIYI